MNQNQALRPFYNFVINMRNLFFKSLDRETIQIMFANLAFVSLLISLGVEAFRFDEDFFIFHGNFTDRM